MPIAENITGSAESLTTKCPNPTSDAIVSGLAANEVVELQCLAPGATKWVTIGRVRGAIPVQTPDPDVDYKFVARGISSNPHVYLGP